MLFFSNETVGAILKYVIPKIFDWLNNNEYLQVLDNRVC